MVVPAMDKLDEDLTNMSLNKSYLPAIRAAITFAKKTVNRYYDKTDHSELYRISMGKLFFHSLSMLLTHHTSVLHPQYKLTYFKNANWEQEWIDSAERITREEYNRKWTKPTPCEGPEPSNDRSQSSDTAEKVCVILSAYSSSLTQSFVGKKS